MDNEPVDPTAELPRTGWLHRAGPPPPPPRGWIHRPADETLPIQAVEAAEDPATELQSVVTAPEILPERPSGWRRFVHRPHLGRRGKFAFVGIGALLILGCAGVAFATLDYTGKYEGRILPGSFIAGVDVSGLDREEAIDAVELAIAPQLDRDVTVTFEDRDWVVSPRELGATSNAVAAVDAALTASRESSFFTRARMKIFGSEFDFNHQVAIDYSRKEAAGFVQGIASGFDREPREAALDYDTGWLKVHIPREGREVVTTKTTRSLMRALRDGSDETELKVAITPPESTEHDYDQVLFLRQGENKLYLYEDGKITHEWLVATGQPAYPTPLGEYVVTEKRYMPTWVNPDPEGWGADMPLMIPPGIGNPLGLRAINWSADAIRFHGTTATYSLGYAASHGCVRMANEDVIELYDMIDVGTPIVSISVSTADPLYDSAPDPTLVEEDAGQDRPGTDEDEGKPKKKGD